jgi:cysteine desulfurase/selenocysteine lyase
MRRGNSLRKEDFPLLTKKPIIYFDSAATTQKPRAVIDAISSFYENDYATVHRAIYQLAARSTELYNEARKTVANFIHALPEEVIFTRGTTESLNLLAHIFPFKEGDEIIISALEHHSNIVPWQMAAARHNLRLKVIPVLPSGLLDLEAYKKLLSPQTALVSLGWIANSIGTTNPIKEMIALAHNAGALFMVDAAQAAPHLPIDVRALDVDFLAFSSHKCYGPTGIGVLFGKKELLEELPPWHGGGDMIDTVTFEKTTYAAPPLRFEAGTPMIAEAIGFKAALDYLSSLGLDAIQKHEEALTARCLAAMRQIPQIKVIGSPEGSIISFVASSVHPLDLASWLDMKGVCLRSGHLCAQPALSLFGQSALLRISFGLYNTLEEVDRFIILLKECLSFFK